MRKEKFNTIAFDGFNDLSAYFAQPGKSPLKTEGEGQSSFFGGASIEECKRMLLTGDTSRVASAEAMLDKFDIHLPTDGVRLDLSPAGFMPCVPEFLGGSPECMFNMCAAEDDAQPLKVIVDPSSSAGVDPESLRKRGTVILAAVMALSAQRPVQLEVVAQLDCGSSLYFNARNGRCNYCAIRVSIPSAPLDLASACYALSHPGFARALMYGIGVNEFASPLHWGDLPGVDMRNTRDPKTIAACCEMLGEDPDATLFVPACHFNDPAIKNPEQWVAEVLKKYGHTELA